MKPSSFLTKSFAVLASTAVILGATPATSSAQLPPLPPLPSIEEIQAGAAAAAVVIGAVAAASSGDGGLNTNSLSGATPGQTTGTPLNTLPLVHSSTDFSKQSRTIRGDVFNHSVSTRMDFTTTRRTAEYNLGRKYSTLTTTLGLTDDSSDTKNEVLMTFYVDDRKVQEKRVPFNAQIPVSINLKDGLRLKVTFEKLRKPVGGNFGLTAVMGNAQLR